MLWYRVSYRPLYTQKTATDKTFTSSVTVISILRMRAIYILYYPPTPPNPDPLYDIGFVYSTVECNLAIITASIPPLHGLMRKWFPRFFQMNSAKNSAYNGYNNGGSQGGVPTIGGSGGVVLKELKSPTRSHRSHTRLGSLPDSEEEILGKAHITRTTSVQITYEHGREERKTQPSFMY